MYVLASFVPFGQFSIINKIFLLLLFSNKVDFQKFFMSFQVEWFKYLFVIYRKYNN